MIILNDVCLNIYDTKQIKNYCNNFDFSLKIKMFMLSFIIPYSVLFGTILNGQKKKKKKNQTKEKYKEYLTIKTLYLRILNSTFTPKKDL